jgi:hypothetical protein
MRVPSQLMIVDDVIGLQQCRLYKAHVCAVVNDHHVCPKSWFERAGVLVDTPMIVLCPNCHANTHAAIDGLIKGQSITHVPFRCRTLARQAFTLASARALTPGLTL